MAESSQESHRLLELSHVFKAYWDGKVQALQDVSCSVQAGDHLAITGKSGSGKSTLLHVMSGLDRPSSGEVFYRGESLRHLSLDALRAEHFGFVFQTFYLLPNLTALENVQIPLMVTIGSARERARRAEEGLTLVGLSDRLDHLPSQLSHGQRQRVAIARALANKPSILFADEPTGSLDSQSGQEVMELLMQLHQQLKMTLVIVTHDAGVAELATRRWTMQDGRLHE